MPSQPTTIRIDSEVKQQAQELLNEFGLDMATAVNIFFRQVIRERRIPFAIGDQVPSPETYQAMAEVDDMRKNPDKYPSYTDVDLLMEDLLK